MDRGGLVRGVVVQDQVQLQVLRHRGVNELEEAQELLVAVPPVVLGDDRSAREVECGEQAGFRAVRPACRVSLIDLRCRRVTVARPCRVGVPVQSPAGAPAMPRSGTALDSKNRLIRQRQPRTKANGSRAVNRSTSS